MRVYDKALIKSITLLMMLCTLLIVVICTCGKLRRGAVLITVSTAVMIMM